MLIYNGSTPEAHTGGIVFAFTVRTHAAKFGDLILAVANFFC